MARKLDLTLACAAGLLGGALSHYVWTQPVLAQSREIRAHDFVLEDANGKTLGTLSVETPQPGRPGRAAGAIRLFDERGREIWRSPIGGVTPLAQ